MNSNSEDQRLQGLLAEHHRRFGFSLLDDAQRYVLVVDPAPRDGADGEELLRWIRASAALLDESLVRWGGILFRGFGLSVGQFKAMVDIIGAGPAGTHYRGGAAPRVRVDETLFLATESPPAKTLQQHHELSYLTYSPSHIMLHCETPATSGGETPICSTRRFMERIRPSVVDRFRKTGVRYRRYLTKEDLIAKHMLGWKRIYDTEDPRAVEEHLRKNGFHFEWRANDDLVVWNVAPGLKVHPITREELWHNVAHAFYRKSEDDEPLHPAFVRSNAAAWTDEVRSYLEACPVDRLPANCSYGDGTPIEREVIDEICTIFDEEQRSFPWQAGDCVVLDNLLSSHGRAPFIGPQRRVLVSWKFAPDDPGLAVGL